MAATAQIGPPFAAMPSPLCGVTVGHRQKCAFFQAQLLRLPDCLLKGSSAHDIGVSPPLSTQHIISLFIFGMAFGELLLGPLSDALGRKKALILGLSIYAVGTVIAMLAGSLEMLILGRFLQGVGVSGPKIATRAIIRDQFEGDAMARVMSFMFTLFILVPMLAPALAQAVIATAGWRSIFAFYLVFAGVLGLWLILRHPKTLPLERRIAFCPRLLFRNAQSILVNRRVTLLILPFRCHPIPDFQAIPALRPEDHGDPGMRIELQLGLHHQCQSLMATTEVHRPCCDQDRQSLPRDNHAVPRIARTKAATRSTGTSPGTLTTRSEPISKVTIPDVAATGSGTGDASVVCGGSVVIARGTKAGSIGSSPRPIRLDSSMTNSRAC